MKKLTAVELSEKAHKDFKIKNDAVLKNIAGQHLMNLRAIEISQAAVCYPIFASKNGNNDFWSFSAMTSFTPAQNLFVKDNKFQATYRPNSVQTYPFFLINSPKKENSYTVGIVEDYGDFSKTSGEALFDKDGKPTATTSKRVQMLEEDVHNGRQSAQFGLALEKLGLFQELEMNIQLLNGEQKILQGLHTINEDRLQNLSVEELEGLHKEGYLKPLYAMIISLLQVNQLIALNNENIDRMQINRVQMIPTKNTAVS